MAGGWVKSLQCKSKAVDDVINPHILTSSSCKNSFQSLRDVADNSKAKTKPKPKDKNGEPFGFVKRCDSVKSGSTNWVRRSVSAPITKYPVQVDHFFPSVTELQVGHPSRNVVEIIFHTRWGPKGFSGRVEVVFKIQNLGRTVARFEEYRAYIKSRAGPGCGSGRCVADGNEMMRFQCLGVGVGPTNSAGSTSTSTSVCTYSGSGAAHESAGGGRGRRAMLLCRVIAGRVSKKPDSVTNSADSVSGDNGELVVFDSRAVLPCFLVIYNL